MAYDKPEAKALVNKVLDIQNHAYQGRKFRSATNDSPTEAYPTIPPNHNVLGEVIREPRIRPVATVRFQYAIANVWGKPDPIPLYDRSFTYLNALVNEF